MVRKIFIPNLSRRDFFKLTGVLSAAVAASQINWPQPLIAAQAADNPNIQEGIAAITGSVVEGIKDGPVYLDPTAPLNARVDAILNLMTDYEKLGCFNSLPTTLLADGYSLSALGNGGVEGLHGSGNVAQATMFPQAIGFGSTWDTSLIEAIGNVVGFEVRSKNGINNLRAWAPVADTRMNPLAGRYEEGYGEDPFLSGTLGTFYAFGLKGRDPFYIQVKPEMKHFFAYDHEWNRCRSSSSMSSRAINEFTIVPYAMPVKAGAVLGAMNAYNLVNGVPAIIHPIRQTMRDEWAPTNFMGVPDAWDEYNLYNTKGAPYVYPLQVPTGADSSYAAGLSSDPTNDLENRNTTAALLLLSGMSNFTDGNSAGFNGSTYAMFAVAHGTLGVSMVEVNRVVRDWLAYKIRIGALDPDAPFKFATNSNPQNIQSSIDLAYLAAQAQMVLLKNANNILPLNKGTINKLAVIGPLADQNLRDYYSPKPTTRVTPLQGIQTKIGAAKVDFFNGNDTVAWKSVSYGTFMTAATGSAQMTAGYTPSATPIVNGYRLPDGTYISTAQAFNIYAWGFDQNFFRSMSTGNYVNTDQVIINSATQLRTSQSGMPDSNGAWNTNQNFHYLLNADGTRSIYGVDYIENDQFYRQFPTGRYVQAGSATNHPLAPIVSYTQFDSGDEPLKNSCKFNEFVLEIGTIKAAAVAQPDDYAVVVVGNNVLVNARESQDRPGLALSPQQSALVHATAAAKPGKTIVVIVSSYPFAVKDIQDDPNVAAIIYTSHAGQAAGTALADVLFGDYAPAGRLSSTWLVDESSLPQMGPDADGHEPIYTVNMLEDDALQAKLTYRFSDAAYIYPFGHGLTYTTFEYKNLLVAPEINREDTFDVKFDITNTGSVTSDEVAQIYMHSKESAYGNNVSKKQLVGFQRVKGITPGETRSVTIQVIAKDMFVWDVISQSNIVETGNYDLWVGASSADIRLSTNILFHGQTIGDLDLSTHRNAWEYYTISRGVSHWEVSKQNTLARKGGYYTVASVVPGDYIGFTKVRMDKMNLITLKVATTTASWANVENPAIEVRADTPNGELLGTVTFDPTGGLQTYIEVTVDLEEISGVHNLYLVFQNGGIYLDQLQLAEKMYDNYLPFVNK